VFYEQIASNTKIQITKNTDRKIVNKNTEMLEWLDSSAVALLLLISYPIL